MRARAFTWVLTRSCQFTTDFGEAVMDFGPRAMLTAGISRENFSSALTALAALPEWSAGIASRTRTRQPEQGCRGTASSSRTLLSGISVSIVVTGERQDCQSYSRNTLPTRYMPVPVRTATSLSRSRKTTRLPYRRAARGRVKILRRRKRVCSIVRPAKDGPCLLQSFLQGARLRIVPRPDRKRR